MVRLCYFRSYNTYVLSNFNWIFIRQGVNPRQKGFNTFVFICYSGGIQEYWVGDFPRLNRSRSKTSLSFV